MIKAAVMGIAAAMLALYMKSVRPEYSSMISISAGIFIFGFALICLQKITGSIQTLGEYLAVSPVYIRILLRITGASGQIDDRCYEPSGTADIDERHYGVYRSLNGEMAKNQNVEIYPEKENAVWYRFCVCPYWNDSHWCLHKACKRSTGINQS